MNENEKKTGQDQDGELPTVIVDETLLNETAPSTNAPAEPAETVAEEPQPSETPNDGATEPPPPAEDVDDRELEEQEQALQKRNKLLGNIGKVAAVLIALAIAALIVIGIVSVIRDAAKPAAKPAAAAVTTNVTVETPAIKALDASGCQPGQWYLDGNKLVFQNCAVPIFHE